MTEKGKSAPTALKPISTLSMTPITYMRLTASNFAARLQQPRENHPGKWMACCPAHDDSSPSLSIREAEDTAPIFTCYAGCDRRDILRAMGLANVDVCPYPPGQGSEVLSDSWIRLGADLYRCMGPGQLQRHCDGRILLRDTIASWSPRTVYFSFLRLVEPSEGQRLSAAQQLDFADFGQEWLVGCIDSLVVTDDVEPSPSEGGALRPKPKPLTNGKGRLERQLRTQVPARIVSLDTGREQLRGHLLDFLDGDMASDDGPTNIRSLLVQITTGVGKTHEALEILRQIGIGLIAMPTHALAQEVFDRFGAEHATYRKGVVENGCLVPHLAQRLQLAGGSVPEIMCPTCPKKDICTATDSIGSGEVIITVHALLPSQKKTAGPWFIDETPELLREVSVDNISGALRVLRAELKNPKLILRRECLEALLRFSKILAEVEYDSQRKIIPRTPLEIHDASWNEQHEESQAKRSYRSGDLWSNAYFLRKMGDRMHEVRGELVLQYRADLDGGIEPGFNYVQAAPEDQQRVVDALEILGPIRRLAWALSDSGPVEEGLVEERSWRRRSKLWRGTQDQLIGIELTPIGRKLREGNVIFLDATPDLDALRMLRPEIQHVRIDVGSSDKIKRILRYFPHGSKRHLTKERALKCLKAGLETMREEGVSQVLVCTHMAYEATLEASEAIAEFRRKGMTIEIRHFHAIRGLDAFKHFDGFLSIGDPWRNLGSHARFVELLECEHDATYLQNAADELGQFHGRGRGTTRSTAAVHIHYGMVAPCDWYIDDLKSNAIIEYADIGRPCTSADARAESATEIRRLCKAIGSRSEIAKQLGVRPETITRWRKGETIPCGDALNKLRLLAGKRDRKLSTSI